MQTTLSAVRPSPAVRGFTLIELLTVIAIIGILAAILIPVVGRVRQSAFASKSTGNLRQLCVAANMYANENKGYYPPVNGFNNQGQVDYSKPWSNDSSFIRYFSIKPDPINPWKPGDQAIHRSGFPSATPYPTEPGRASIGYNSTDVYDYSAPAYLRTKQALKQTDVREPGRLLMFAEGVDYKLGYGGRTGWTPAHDTGQDQSRTDKIAFRAAGEKAIIVTYGGGVRMLTRAQANSRPLWSNFSPNSP